MPATAHDCGTAVGWRTPAITVAIDTPQTRLQKAAAAAIVRGARRWLDAPCGGGKSPNLRVDTAVRNDPDLPAGNAGIHVTFAEAWPAERGTFATTRLQFDASGRIANARATFYMTVLAPYGDGPMLESIALHEIGHALGLAHAQDGVPAVMDEEVHGGGREALTLTPDDIAAICAAYPPNE